MRAPLDFRALFAFCDLHASRCRRHELTFDLTLGPLAGMLAHLECPRYFDRQGFPIPGEILDDGTFIEPTLAWARRFERDPLYRNVAQSDYPDHSLLSTAWLGLDHNFGGRPLFFETMYFSGEIKTSVLPTGGEFDYRPTLEFPVPDGEPGEMTEQLRYGNEEEALAMHHAIDRQLRKRWEC